MAVSLINRIVMSKSPKSPKSAKTEIDGVFFPTGFSANHHTSDQDALVKAVELGQIDLVENILDGNGTKYFVDVNF